MKGEGGPERLDVLYVDNHVLAVVKPAGLVTQPSGAHADSLESRAKAYVKARFRKPGNVFLEAIHRLDRPVGGVVVFARTSKAVSRLNACIREGQTMKRYWAVVHGRLDGDQGMLEDWLRHGSRRAEVVSPGCNGGKRATLRFRAEAVSGPFTLVDVELMTGRYHQIRIQFSHRGHPIVGDDKYGSDVRLDGGQIALFHREITITHPVRRERMTFAGFPPAGVPWSRFRDIVKHPVGTDRNGVADCTEERRDGSG